MSGVLGVLLGSGGASRYQMAVGQYSDGFKGIWWIYYGFGIANNYYPIGGALSPTTFKGQTIQGIYSVEDNVGSTWPVTLQVQGDQPAGFATAVTMGGTKYSFDTWAQDYGSSLTVTINIATATFTVSSTSGIANGTPVQFTTGGTLPSGLVANTKYYARDVTATTFKVATTPGGAAITWLAANLADTLPTSRFSPSFLPRRQRPATRQAAVYRSIQRSISRARQPLHSVRTGSPMGEGCCSRRAALCPRALQPTPSILSSMPPQTPSRSQPRQAAPRSARPALNPARTPASRWST